MKFIQLTRNDAFLLLPGKSKMASKIDRKVDPCRKNENDPEKSKYMNVENKKNEINNCI